MQLETFFKDEDINEIYEYLIIYAMFKYNELSPVWQQDFSKVIKKFKEKNLSVDSLKNYNLNQVKIKLNTYQDNYNMLLKINKNIIKELSPSIEQIIIEEIIGREELHKISFLFDFITNYVTYSEDYFNYCLDLPLTDGFNFDFKQNIPVDSSIPGMLVMGQGICDDISNLLIYLGNKLNLRIDKVICNYNNNLHSLNSITLNNGKNYLIDATRLIRKNKTKEECFLVSQTTLNKNKEYEFKENMLETFDYKEEIPSYKLETEALIEKLKKYLPIEKDINYKSKK